MDDMTLFVQNKRYQIFINFVVIIQNLGPEVNLFLDYCCLQILSLINKRPVKLFEICSKCLYLTVELCRCLQN